MGIMYREEGQDENFGLSGNSCMKHNCLQIDEEHEGAQIY